ncbi:hypothetical protein Rsub_11575 [Raphidocelis subcapitata]|uniref:Fatty acid hydroxylase domain-containing protein n=1 Tax=Raphidocelis subcapitata TaxID=307507 RepID=A0A2V0PHC9_9CHLO|nr:hypothetical protein Rsub_11575 [Raphidocelis subcapitata]|eukprot:GBF98989.1 hypothetical protein Rsub_11575 [Raphidocelis subcapitata]
MPATRRQSAAAALAAAAGGGDAASPGAAPPSPPPAGAGAGAGAAAPGGVDESGPLVFAVGRMGPEYWRWIERPVAGAPRFFASGALEACSKTPWWVVPLIWLPVAAAAAAAAAAALAAAPPQPGRGPAAAPGWWPAAAPPPPAAARLAALLAAGAALWQLLEYCIHRFLFHARGDGYWAITIHFLFHGCHHKYPLDGMRLVFPPVPAAAIAAAIFSALRAALPRPAAAAVMAGVLLGYVTYDVTHYALHHGGKLPGSYLRDLRLRHSHHHYQDGGAGFQISSPLFDVVMGTRADMGARGRARPGGGGGKGG